MMDLLITHGRVVTRNPERAVIEDGAVAVTGDRIEAVRPTVDLETDYDADQIPDANGSAVIPGLINAHTHVSDILLREAFAADRGLYDWLYNVKRPGTLAMTVEEHGIGDRLFCAEAIQSGVTTFVETNTEVVRDGWDAIEAKLDAYKRAGIRSVYGAGFDDSPDEAFRTLLADIEARNPGADPRRRITSPSISRRR